MPLVLMLRPAQSASPAFKHLPPEQDCVAAQKNIMMVLIRLAKCVNQETLHAKPATA